MESNGIKHIQSHPYHPATNGAAERLVHTFKQSMKAGQFDKLSVQFRLHNFLLTHRSTRHATTGETPALLFLCCQLWNRFDLLRPSLEKKVLSKQAEQKQFHDQHTHMQELDPGDRVLVKYHLDQIPGVIIQRVGNLSYLIRLDDCRVWRRYINNYC